MPPQAALVEALPVPLTEDQTLQLRLHAQHLTSQRTRRAGAVAKVVRELCGIQAQDAGAAALGIRARAAGLRAADVERALVQDRSIVRSWCMRGTLHLLASEDLGWLLGLLGPRFARSNRGRRAQLGLDDDGSRRAIRALRSVMSGSAPLTRRQIVEKLAARRIHLTGQARPHLLSLASLEGIICHGPSQGREPTFVLLAEWIDPGPALPQEEALRQLTQRYLSAYAPAAPEDFAAWSGLPLTEARNAWRGISGGLLEARIGGSPAWMLKTQAKRLGEAAERGRVVRLLPSFDTYLLGYHNRGLVLPGKHARRILPGGGLVHPALLVDGRVLGRWRVARNRNAAEVVVEPFQALGRDVRRLLQVEADDVARFLGVEAGLRVLKPG